MRSIRPLLAATASAAFFVAGSPVMAHAMSYPLSVVSHKGINQNILLKLDAGHASVSLNGMTLEGRVKNTKSQDGHLIGLNATLRDKYGNKIQLFRNGTIRANFTTSSYRGSYSAAAIANPEPSAALLFPLGLAVVAWAYRKKPYVA